MSLNCPSCCPRCSCRSFPFVVATAVVSAAVAAVDGVAFAAVVFIVAVVIAGAADLVAVAVAVAAFLLVVAAVAAVDLVVVEKPFDLPQAHWQQVCSFRIFELIESG